MGKFLKNFHIHWWNYQFIDKKGRNYYHCRCGKFKITEKTKISKLIWRIKNVESE